MNTTHPRRAARRLTSRIGQLAAVLTVVVCGLLASAAVVPGASAGEFVPGPGGAGPVAPVTTTPVHVITMGGTPGWQIALIALGAALIAAASAVLLDRARTGRRAPSVNTA
jgi:hypothetical protein